MSKHDEVANKLAKKFKTEYKSDKGIDLTTRDRVIEVEVKESGISQGIKQVIRSQKPRYLAVSKQILQKALTATQRTGVGLMSQTGKIIKKASRKR